MKKDININEIDYADDDFEDESPQKQTSIKAPQAKPKPQ